MGRRHATVTGAPWLYLLAMYPDAEPEPRREGTIWYPFHGWEGQHVDGDHQRLIDEILDTEPGPVTFCLYWHEYRDARLRARYERAGPGDLPRLPRAPVAGHRHPLPRTTSSPSCADTAGWPRTG